MSSLEASVTLPLPTSGGGPQGTWKGLGLYICYWFQNLKAESPLNTYKSLNKTIRIWFEPGWGNSNYRLKETSPCSLIGIRKVEALRLNWDEFINYLRIFYNTVSHDAIFKFPDESLRPFFLFHETACKIYHMAKRIIKFIHVHCASMYVVLHLVGSKGLEIISLS